MFNINEILTLFIQTPRFMITLLFCLYTELFCLLIKKDRNNNVKITSEALILQVFVRFEFVIKYNLRLRCYKCTGIYETTLFK